jgi:hypothetical protein
MLPDKGRSTCYTVLQKRYGYATRYSADHRLFALRKKKAEHRS